MKRTAERILSSISLVFTFMSLIGAGFFVAFSKTFQSAGVADEFKQELLADPTIPAADIDMIMEFYDVFLEGFSWSLIVILAISFIATIIGMIFIWNSKKPKVAGVLFIIAGIFAFLLTPTSFMLYIAAILSFTRKPSYTESHDSFESEYSKEPMRPL